MSLHCFSVHLPLCLRPASAVFFTFSSSAFTRFSVRGAGPSNGFSASFARFPGLMCLSAPFVVFLACPARRFSFVFFLSVQQQKIKQSEASRQSVVKVQRRALENNKKSRQARREGRSAVDSRSVPWHPRSSSVVVDPYLITAEKKRKGKKNRTLSKNFEFSRQKSDCGERNLITAKNFDVIRLRSCNLITLSNNGIYRSQNGKSDYGRKTFAT
jgi:hypothetical protein